MSSPITSWVLDAPVIAGFAARDPDAEAAVWLAVQYEHVLVVPALALSAALAQLGSSAEQQDALAVLLAVADVDQVGTSRAYALADVLARADAPTELAADPERLAVAHVVSVAADLDTPIITDAAARIHALDPHREIKLLWKR